MVLPHDNFSAPTSMQYSLSPPGSVDDALCTQRKLADLAYRVRFLSNFLSVAREILELVSPQHFNFSLYHKQVEFFLFLLSDTFLTIGTIDHHNH